MRQRVTGPTAAIAWIRVAVQAQGVHTGRRQLVVRFAAEAETATLYNGSMLHRNIERALTASVVHSISIAGHDPLASALLLAEALEGNDPLAPVVIDCDGQRPDSVATVARSVALIQVALTATETAAVTDNAMETLRLAEQGGTGAALAVVMTDRTTDAQVLRVIEQATSAAPGTKIVVHLAPAAASAAPVARYAALMEEAAAISSDVRLLARLPAPFALH